MNDFGVISNSGELLVAFTNECKKMGWQRNNDFNDGPISGATITGGDSSRTCIYFSNKWSASPGTLLFAPSNGGDNFKLPERWDEALEYAKRYLEKNQNKVIKLTSDYDAFINKTDKVVKVGCQEIPFDKVLEIAEHCK